MGKIVDDVRATCHVPAVTRLQCLQKDVRMRPTTEELLRFCVRFARSTMTTREGSSQTWRSKATSTWRATASPISSWYCSDRANLLHHLSPAGQSQEEQQVDLKALTRRLTTPGASQQELAIQQQHVRPAGLPSRPSSAHPRLHVPRELPRQTPNGLQKEANPDHFHLNLPAGPLTRAHRAAERLLQLREVTQTSEVTSEEQIELRPSSRYA
eukprot:768429-Hanusia_phi.AAC.5